MSKKRELLKKILEKLGKTRYKYDELMGLINNPDTPEETIGKYLADVSTAINKVADETQKKKLASGLSYLQKLHEKERLERVEQEKDMEKLLASIG